MSKTNFLTAAAAVALMVGFSVPASAQNQMTPEKREEMEKERQRLDSFTKQQGANAQAAAQEFLRKLAAEQPTTHNAPSSGPFLFTAYNKTERGIWVTFYEKEWYGNNGIGQACIPPGKSAGIASPKWESNKAVIQVEVKTDLRCGGSNIAQKNLLTDGVVVVRGGTSRVMITSTNDPQAGFVQ